MINKVWRSRLCGKVESTIYCVCLPFLFLCLAQFDQGVILHERYEDLSKDLVLHPVYGAHEQRDIFRKTYYITVYGVYMGRTKIPMSNIP